ncbi:MAG: hypothetical protein HYX55_08110 [Chloroflexi bacterium]|nr:hypothetical protein [Chloroflexota bacterium]
MLATALLGCNPTTVGPVLPTSLAQRDTSTIAPTGTAAATSSPDPAGSGNATARCAPDLPSILVDKQLHYRLCMPQGWHDLGLDHAAWIDTFGSEATELEAFVRSGRLDHVVAAPGPARYAPLIIDSNELSASDTLEQRRDSFLDANVELGAKVLSSEIVQLDGIRAARAVLDISDMQGSKRDGLLILYLVPITSELLFIRFTTDAETAAQNEPIFDSIARSLEVEAHAT